MNQSATVTPGPVLAITPTLCELRRLRAHHEAEVARLTALISNTKRDRAICSLLNTN
jgi:hypothetical protein